MVLLIPMISLLGFISETNRSAEGNPAEPLACDGCTLSHQTVGTTTFAVTDLWGLNSEDGQCAGAAGNCTPVAPCEIGAYVVQVTGAGTLQWREDPPGTAFEGKIKVTGDNSRPYGDAANVEDWDCGEGLHQLYFPNDLAGAGPVCTPCE